VVLAALWVAAAGFLRLLPALLRGKVLGNQDMLGTFGLGYVAGTKPYNPIASDQIRQWLPWDFLSWSEVHHGELPLWNPYSGLGLPLLHNFQSAALSLPVLLSYLGPQKYGYTVEIVAMMLIAGIGVLWMCRRLGLGLLPSTLAATAFMLSGSFNGWLGWPMAGTMCWLGWATGCAILLVRSQGRMSYVAALAAVLAFMVYAGHPESLVIALVSVAVITAVALVELVVITGRFRSCVRPVMALAASGLAALGLSAPLLLPGMQVLREATRGTALGYNLPARASANILLAWYDGSQLRGGHYFGAVNFYETNAYVGVIVLVLVVLALALRRRDSFVIGLAAVAVVCALLTYSPFVVHLLLHLPLLKTIQWNRAVIPLDFSLAILGGVGLQVFLDDNRERATRAVWWGAIGVLSLVIGLLWIHHVVGGLPASDARIQARSFIWPVIQLGVLAVVGVALPVGRHLGDSRIYLLRQPRVLAAALLAVETAFLITATPTLWYSSNSYFPVTPAVQELQARVGQARLGYADCPTVVGFPSLGVMPEANVAYGLREIAVFDPVMPTSYFRAYYAEIGQPVPARIGKGSFCPSMSTASVARHFGVAFVLTIAGSKPPPGAIFESKINDENLYRIPGSGVITVEPAGMTPDSPRATVLTSTSQDPNSMKVAVDVARPSTVYFHVTNDPGWVATIDGHALALHNWGGAMLEASIPRGRHVIVMHYRPWTFTVGLILACLTAIALLAGIAGPSLIRSVRNRPYPSGER
jgi:hypothetical protein